MTYDPLDIRGQETDQVEAAKRAALRARDLADDIRWLMSNKRGRRIAFWLLELAGVYRTSFTGNSNSTFFNEGMRNVGLALMKQIDTTCPQHYITMLDEARKHDRHADERRDD